MPRLDDLAALVLELACQWRARNWIKMPDQHAFFVPSLWKHFMCGSCVIGDLGPARLLLLVVTKPDCWSRLMLCHCTLNSAETAPVPAVTQGQCVLQNT
jgi:hypothetical protein